MATQYLTCIFKIHNPSAHKKAVMDHALEEYTRAYGRVLDYAKDSLDNIERNGTYHDRYTGKSIASMLPRPDCNIHSSAKDSLTQNVGANLASYFELVQVDERTSFPFARDPSPDADVKALDHFVRVGSNEDDFKESVRRLMKQVKGSVTPLFFCRSDGATQKSSGSARNRNFSLLTNAKRDKLLAVMWLLPGGHERCKPLNAQQGNLVKLDTGEVFTSDSSTAILVPLELGRSGWQYEKFIEPAMQGQARVKTAYLVRRDEEYFLHVAFEFPCEEEYKPKAYLGIDRGVFFSMAYAVVDVEGRTIIMDHEEDGFRDSCIQAGKRVQQMQRNGRTPTAKDYRTKQREAIIHRLINKIISVAKEHQAMIVTEDLEIRIRGAFYKSAWKTMYDMLAYKCRLAGVPLWKNGIWAAYSSQLCIMCGGLNTNRKRDGSPFACPYCGATYHSDEGAAVNIARRALYRKADWEDKGGYRAFHRSFAKEATYAAE